MAFSEEQEAQILDAMGKFNDFLSSQQKKEEDDKDKNLLIEAKKDVVDKGNEAEAQAELEKALGFNMNISTFAEKYKDVLPTATSSIIDLSNGKTYSSSIAKANEMRKAILEGFLEIQANIEALPEGMKAKANSYKQLTEDAKLEKSGLYWEVVEVGAELLTAKKRMDAVNRANQGGNNNSGEDAFRAKFLALGDKYKRKD